MANRIPKLIAIIGTNGTGKTFTIRRFVQNELAARRKVLIVTPHDNEYNDLPTVYEIDKIKKEQAGKILYDRTQKGLFFNIAREFFDGLLVLDDCAMYLNSNPPVDFKDILISRKQRMMDIIFACHNIDNIPPSVFPYNIEYILKRTSASFDLRKRLIYPEMYDKLVAAQDKVNKLAEKNPFAEILVRSE